MARLHGCPALDVEQALSAHIGANHDGCALRSIIRQVRVKHRADANEGTVAVGNAGYEVSVATVDACAPPSIDQIANWGARIGTETTLEPGNTKRRGGGRMPPHDGAMHVRAVGEVQHQAAFFSALGHVAANTVTASAKTIGRNANAVKIITISHARS